MTMKTIPRLWNRVGIVISEEHAERNPHVIVPGGAKVCEAQDEEITQVRELEHIRLQGAI